MKQTLNGIPASSGIGVGRALLYRETVLSGWERVAEDPEREWQRYREAVERFCARREEKEKRISLSAGPKQAEILHSQVVMAKDPYLDSQIYRLIQSHICAEEALCMVCGRFIESLISLEDEVPRLRAADVKDMQNCLLRQLLGLPEIDFSDLEPGTVLIADELPPSAASSLDPENVQGLVLCTGGRASHCSILARALEIPAVMGVQGVLDAAAQGTLVAVDGSKGLVHLDLTEKETARFKKERADFLRLRASLKRFIGKQTRLRDGSPVLLEANVNGENDVLRAEEYGFNGVGLLRSEYLYQGREEILSEEEEFKIYRKFALALKDRPLTVRSLDVGGDKVLPGLEREVEDNPFLGCRGLRRSLREEELFLSQARAVLRARVFGNVRLLLPMVSGIGEVRRAKLLLEQAKDQLRERGEAFGEDLPLGVMIETPAAAQTADLLAEEADFFSVGTNDLVQYVMAVDRENATVAYLYSCCYPAVLRMLRYAVECANRAGIPIGLCGEAATDPLLLPVFLGLGIREFSVRPAAILLVRRLLSLWSGAETEDLVRRAMELPTEEEVRGLLERESRQ